MSDVGARVILCQPIYGHVPPNAHLAQIELVLHAGTHGNLQGIVTARDTYIDWGRNHIVRQCYDQFPDFTHLLWLDGDIIAPVDSLDRLLKSFSHSLLADEHPGAVGGLYVKKGHPFEPVAYDYEPQEKDGATHFHGTYERTKKLDLTRDALYMVHGLGMGLTLVTRELVDAVQEHTNGMLFQTTLAYGEDVWFFHWSHQLGFTSWLDTSVRCRHIGDYEFSTSDWERARDE